VIGGIILVITLLLLVILNNNASEYEGTFTGRGWRQRVFGRGARTNKESTRND